jgi:hypothetical protein
MMIEETLCGRIKRAKGVSEMEGKSDSLEEYCCGVMTMGAEVVLGQEGVDREVTLVKYSSKIS